MTTKTKLSNEETARWHRHSCLCAFAAPNIQAMSNTVPSCNAEFLIANLELEFELNHRKQSPLRISNRKYFAIFPLNPPHFPAFAPSRPTNSKSSIHTIRISTKPSNITTYTFSGRNKIDLFAICLRPRFSPRKGTSRDMIPALALLQ
jgi:hypothetical protein